MNRLVRAARSRWGRVAAALAGIAAVALIVRGLGLAAVGAALSEAAAYFPAILALELAILACSTLSLRALYGAEARRVPARQFVRAALVGYAVQGVVPAGRAAAEAVRASLLRHWIGGPRAAAAAGRMQAVVLVANGLVSIPAAIAAVALGARSWIAIAIAINAAITLGLGTAVLVLARRGHVGAWLGRHFERVREFGAELDQTLEHEPVVPVGAIAWEFAGRCVQIVQAAVLIACVGGAVGVAAALCAEGIHLVGAAVGDLIPAQLGATEGNFTLSASALSLTRADAVAIALLAHVAQLVWVLVGSIVPLVWRPAPGVYRQPEEPT